MVGIIAVMETSFKRTYAHTVVFTAPDSTEGHCQPMLPLEIPGHSQQAWFSFLWGHCSFLLGPGAHKVLFVSSKSLCFPSPLEVL